jgi:short-subunit dehydrogenase
VVVVDISGARALVAGATGVLGGGIARALHSEGGRVALAGRDERKLAALADELGGVPISVFDALDVKRCAAVVDEAADALGGLDVVVVAIGVAAFGPADAADDAVTEHLLAVNTKAPMALARAGVARMTDGGAVAVLSAILADYPTAGMAAYSASKAGLSAWLTAVRPELRRRGVTVFDVRPPHIETGLAGRAIAGQAPPMKAAATVDQLVSLVVSTGSGPGAASCATTCRRASSPDAEAGRQPTTSRSQLRNTAAPASPDFSGWNWVADSAPFSTAATKSSPWLAQVTSGGRIAVDTSISHRRTPKLCTK